MKILIIAMLISVASFGQKKLKENFGNYRIHEIQSFSIDTLESGEIKKVANIIVLREGIDGSYKVEVSTTYGNNDATIDYLITLSKFNDFIVVIKTDSDYVEAPIWHDNLSSIQIIISESNLINLLKDFPEFGVYRKTNNIEAYKYGNNQYMYVNWFENGHENLLKNYGAIINRR